MANIITFAQQKGGAGKTTVAQMIIGAVGHQGFSVGVVDCDPNGTLSNWISECSNLDLDYKHVSDDTQIVAQARKLEAKNDLVVIDTAGFHSQATIFAVGTGMSPELIGQGANLLLVLPNSRGDESESDILGMRYMAQAGFDPRAAVQLWQNMARAAGGRAPAEFMSTHPSHDTRIRDLNNELRNAMPLYEQARAAGRRPSCRG